MVVFENQRNEIMAFVSGLNQRHGSDEMRIRCEICETVSGETCPEDPRQEADAVYVPVGECADAVKQRILLALTEEIHSSLGRDASRAAELTWSIVFCIVPAWYP